MTRPARPAAANPTDASPRTPAGLHSRNRYQGEYDFPRLVDACPALAGFLISTPAGSTSIDFSNPAAVRMLNQALLHVDYGIRHWEIPDGYLCPPTPGRADYVHGLADLLASCNGGVIPHGPAIRALDIGVGASCIYPLIGQAEYGWHFVGSDVDRTALATANAIVKANNGLAEAIELREQAQRGKIFAGLLRDDEQFDLTLCNPPFHSSAEEAARGSQRKWRNLRKSTPEGTTAPLNFGGQATELWCTGGEASFVRRMINESAAIGSRVYWFSSLVSKADNLAKMHNQLKKVGVRDVRVAQMAQGNKQSRFVAWTFLDAAEREAWRGARWKH